jgi:flagellar M-ring protein FliF
MPNFTSAKDTWKSIEPRGQLTMVVSFLLILVTAYFLFNYATKPSYTTLQTGLQPTQTNRVTQALAGAGIAYKVGNGGTTVSVVSGQISAAQVALASAGVGPGAQPGLANFTKTSLGTTDAQQKAMYQLGLQGDIERQIESITGVTSAQVQIVMPTDTLFADQASQATASVLLTTDTTFDPGAVSGIAHMVASGVQGLSAQNVTARCCGRAARSAPTACPARRRSWPSSRATTRSSPAASTRCSPRPSARTRARRR